MGQSAAHFPAANRLDTATQRRKYKNLIELLPIGSIYQQQAQALQVSSRATGTSSLPLMQSHSTPQGTGLLFQTHHLVGFFRLRN